MNRRETLKLLCAIPAALVLPHGAYAQGSYPSRPITFVVPWAAGGGTDATARIVASLLERDLKQPINVVNRTGGGGVVGHSAIATAAPDGYTIGMATVEIGMMHWQGLTDLTWQSYTPIALVNEDPGAIHVRADAKWSDLKALLAEVKANPGKLRSSGSAKGAIWHLALAGLLRELGVAPDAVVWVPGQGAAPALQELVSGGIEMVVCSMPEARALIEAGRVKPLAIMSAQRDPAHASLPTIQEAVGQDMSGKTWTIGAWRGILAPKNLPAPLLATLTSAIENVYKSADYKEFMSRQGLAMRWAGGSDFSAFLKDSNDKLGATMKEVGLAK